MSEIETVKTKIETTALDFINKHKIPYVKLSITYYKDKDGKTKKDVGSCPTEWRTYNYDEGMEYNNNGFHSHEKGMNINIERGGYIVLDTDSKESEDWLSARLNGRKAPTTNTMKGRHRYIKYTGRPLTTEKNFGHINVDFLTNNTFEQTTRNIKYHDIELEMTKEELEDLLGVKTRYSTETKTDKKKNATSPKIIERYLFENNNAIDRDVLFQIIDGLNPEEFISHGDWLKFVIGIYNQVPGKPQMAEYYDKMLSFLKRQSTWTEKSEQENFLLFNFSLPNKKEPTQGITGSTIWMWLYKQNNDLWKKLKVKKSNLDAVAFNKIQDYNKQRKEFEKTNFKINSEKIAYIEKDLINGKDIFRSQDGFKRRFQKLKSVTLDEKGEVINKGTFTDRWLTDEVALEYDTIDFLPTPLKLPAACYNLFSGFMIDKTPIPEDWEDVDTSLIWKHLKNLAGNDEDVYEYYCKWFAHRIQYPGILPKVALVWRSKQGCGKNCFLDFIGNNIIGSEYYATSANINDYIGTFANIDKGRILCVINEADPKDTHSNMSRLKEKITDPYISWESKGVDKFTIRNCAGFVLPTNMNNSVKVDEDDRRIMAQECSTNPINELDYFEILIPLMECPKHAYKFYQQLKDIEVTHDYNFKKHRPLTDEYLKMKLYNIPVLVRFTGWLLDLEDTKGNPRDLNMLRIDELWEYYKKYCETCNIHCNITQHKFFIDYTKGDYSYCLKIEKDCHKKVYITVNRDTAQDLVDTYSIKLDEFSPI